MMRVGKGKKSLKNEKMGTLNKDKKGSLLSGRGYGGRN